jgi:hypothetical protein
MSPRQHRLVGFAWATAYRLLLALVLVGVANFWGFSSPNGFVKCAAIEHVQKLPLLPASGFRYFFQPELLMANLPRGSQNSAEPWIIDPDTRAKLVIEQGLGNCSYRSKGLARVLQGIEVPYSIVWIMHQSSVRSGNGHTVIECPVQLNDYHGLSIVDMLEGGVPFFDGRPTRAEDLLTHKPLVGTEIRTFSNQYDNSSIYYSAFLADAAVGITTSEDMNRYMDAISATYLDVGYPKFEKAVYVLGAMIVGVYPPVYMTSGEIARFDVWFRFEMFLARSMIWAIRVMLLLAVVDILRLAWRASRGAELSPRAR